MKIDVIIPAFNEEGSIGNVIRDIPKYLVRHIVVGNNGSTDRTALFAAEQGAIVVTETRKGYGHACLKAVEYILQLEEKPDILVFLDGDYSDYPEELALLIAPITEHNFDFVIGSRALGQRTKGSMTIPQIFGNWLACFLIQRIYGYTFTDLGPFRAITWEAYNRLQMEDKTFGWTVEMQIKVAKLKMKFTEIPVNYRNRIGKSKVSGTVKGTIMAGYKILWMIFKSIKNK